MTVAVEQEKEMAEFGSEINSVNPSDYSCQILLEKTTLEAGLMIKLFQMMLD